MPFRAAVAKAGADHLLVVIYPREMGGPLTGISRYDESAVLRVVLPEG